MKFEEKKGNRNRNFEIWFKRQKKRDEEMHRLGRKEGYRLEDLILRKGMKQIKLKERILKTP